MIYTIEEITERVRPVAEKYGLRSVYVFGSYARGDATEKSDVDLLVDIEGVVFKPFGFFGLYDDFCVALEKEVDMVTVNALEEQRGKPLGGRFVEEVELDRRRIV